jgi:uncharacterized membrane protein
MLILLPDIGIWWIVLLPVVLAYRAKKRTAGTIYESHAEWVFLTFAYPFVGGMALTVPLLFIFDKLFSSSETGVIIFLIIGMLFGIWTIYRIIKGCLFMYRKQPIVRPKFLF